VLGRATGLELARLHVESAFELDARGRTVRVREPEDVPQAHPRFYLVRTGQGNVALVSAGLPQPVAERLLELVAEEPPLGGTLEAPPVHREEYIEALREDGPIGLEYAGPAFVLPDGIVAPSGPVRIAAENAGLLERHFAWAREHLERRQPVWVAVEDGAAVAICHCARVPGPAIEAGVETVEAYRGRGLATGVVAAWAAELRSRRVVPLYSTSWGSTASRRIAARLGGELYGVTFSLR
jgi:GNAT superfamily N-acetyltransferase